jgi:hypothetical protein
MIPRFPRFVIAALLFLCAASLHAQGTLEIVGGDTHDWGTVSPGKLTTIVELKNVGASDLNISAVRPTCLCTVAPIDKNLLKPGEVAHVDITLDATSKFGPVERSIVIHSSDSSAPQRTLHLKATIKRDLTITPSNYLVVDGAMKDVESAAVPIVIANTGKTVVTLSPPGAPQGNFKARFDLLEQKELKPGEQLELKAFITPLVASGMTGTIKMRTTSPQMPFIDLTVTGTMVPADKSQSH